MKNFDVITAINITGRIPSRVDIVVCILQVYNCRIQEILSARWENYYPGKYLILRGCKHSRDIIIRDRMILQCISRLHPIDTSLIFAPVSYYNVYKHIEKYYSHLFDKKYNKKNRKITHYFRYDNVASLDKRKDVTNVLSHGSKHSAKYYNSKARE